MSMQLSPIAKDSLIWFKVKIDVYAGNMSLNYSSEIVNTLSKIGFLISNFTSEIVPVCFSIIPVQDNFLTSLFSKS